MHSNNKINARSNHIEVENAQFHQFVQTLKDHHPNRYTQRQPSHPNHSELSHPPPFDEESSPISKDLYSERSRSLQFHTNRRPQISPVICGGDQVLKYKARFGVASRSTVKQYQLPPQYFTPTKLKLQQYLKDSRVLSHAELTQNQATAPKQIIQQKQIKSTQVARVQAGRSNFHSSTLYKNSGCVQKSREQDYAKQEARDAKSQRQNNKLQPNQSSYNNGNFRIRGNSHQRDPIDNQFTNHRQNNISFYNQSSFKQSKIDPWSNPQRASRPTKPKPRTHFNDLLQFSYPFGQLPDQGYSQKPHANRAVWQNPENRVLWKRAGGRQKPNQLYSPNWVGKGGYDEESDSGQEQPLQLKC